mmetsp:Transcript_5854/g.14915  ORF Transcript_5854/g.14915 Transcript_5854/m.14915 type:complete len:206 (-) Transcript_5854:373-990(-)
MFTTTTKSLEDLPMDLPEGAYRDERGHLWLPPTQREDGSWRDPVRIRSGYLPPDEVQLYRSPAIRARLRSAFTSAASLNAHLRDLSLTDSDLEASPHQPQGERSETEMQTEREGTDTRRGQGQGRMQGRMQGRGRGRGRQRQRRSCRRVRLVLGAEQKDRLAPGCRRGRLRLSAGRRDRTQRHRRVGTLLLVRAGPQCARRVAVV